MNDTALLYSGGLDSCTLALKLDKEGTEYDKWYFDFDTKYTKAEKSRLPTDCQTMLVHIDIFEGEDALVPNRNTYMISQLALMGYKKIVIGSTKDDTKHDNSKEFISAVNKALQDCEVIAPLVNFTKQQVYNVFKVMNGKDEDYFTCYTPLNDGSSCGECSACTVDGGILKFDVNVDPIRTDEFLNFIERSNKEWLGNEFDEGYIDNFDEDIYKWVTLHTIGVSRMILAYAGIKHTGELCYLRVCPLYRRCGLATVLVLIRGYIGMDELETPLWMRTRNNIVRGMSIYKDWKFMKREEGFYYYAK